jgi:hypothetical protein
VASCLARPTPALDADQENITAQQLARTVQRLDVRAVRVLSSRPGRSSLGHEIVTGSEQCESFVSINALDPGWLFSRRRGSTSSISGSNPIARSAEPKMSHNGSIPPLQPTSRTRTIGSGASAPYGSRDSLAWRLMHGVVIILLSR